MPQTPETTASDKLVHELTVATDASIGVIVIRCPDTEVYRVCDDLYALATSQQLPYMQHTSETGWQTFALLDPDDTRGDAFDPTKSMSDDTSTAEVGKAFAALYGAGSGNQFPLEGFFVMLDLHHTFEEMKTQTRIRKQAHLSLNNDQRLFIVVPRSATIPEAVGELMHVIEFGYPSRSELHESLADIINALEDSDKPEMDEDMWHTIVSNGQGMTTNAFETAVAVAITEYTANNENLEGFGFENIIESIRTYKTEMLNKTNVLELQPSLPAEEIGGLDLFKAWMNQRKNTFTDAAKERGVTPSRGALVVGPPGTGKSMVAKAAGSMLGLPVIRFDVGRVFNQFIGQSEGAMRNVLALIDAMAPCVLMVDEIDKGFSGMSGGSNDGGTTQRVFGTFLTWMQERDQVNRPVFMIMTANRVEGLPPELLRRGRLDEIWAVGVPFDAERSAIAKIHLQRRGQKISKGDLASFTRISNGLVGAEIEAVIEDALVASLETDDGVTFELLEEARSTLKSMSETRKDEFDYMASWADKNARVASSEHPIGKKKKVDTSGPRKRVRPKITRAK